MKKRTQNILYKISTVSVSIGVILLLGFIVILCFQGFINPSQSIDLTRASGIGDFVGGLIGTIFTLVGVLLLFLTFHTQKKELKETKKELKLSRKSFEKQAQTSQIQQFESTFFNLLSNHNQILQLTSGEWFINAYKDSVILEGRALFDTIVMYMKNVYEFERSDIRTTLQPLSPFSPIHEVVVRFGLELEDGRLLEVVLQDYPDFHVNTYTGEDKVRGIYSVLYDKHKSSLGHYFRNLFLFIKFIDKYEGFDEIYSEAEVVNLKYQYVKILRAQLSTNEIILLWYNSLSELGRPFQGFLKKYKLLKNVDFNAEIVYPELLISQYEYLNES